MLHVHPADLGALMMHALQQLRDQNVRKSPSCRAISFRRAADGMCSVRDDGKMLMPMF